MTIAAPGVTASLRELIALRERVSGGVHHARLPAAPGGHASARRSRGMEFAEARPYQPGDDVRSIDWRQTARRGRAYTKLFQEEHERPVQLLVDVGPSMRFGTRVAFKSVVAARAAALLAWMACAAGDRVGGVVCSGATHEEIRAQGQQHGVLHLLRSMADVLATMPAAEATDMALPLRAMARMLRPGSLVVLLSDFTALNAGVENEIAALGRRAEVVLAQVYDTFEADAPPPGRYRVSDGSRQLTLDLRANDARAAYANAFAGRCAALQALAQRSGARLLPLPTHSVLGTVLPQAFPGLSGWRGRA